MLLAAFIKVTKCLGIFHGEGNVHLWVFQCCYVPNQVYPTRHWRCFTVDQLLKEGDKLNLNAFGNGEIPSESISLNCLPNRIYWPFPSSLWNQVRTSSVNSLTMNKWQHIIMNNSLNLNNQLLKSMLLIRLLWQKRYLVMKCQVYIQQFTLLKEQK